MIVKTFKICAVISTVALVAIAVGNLVSAYQWHVDLKSREPSFKDKASEMATSGEFKKLEATSRKRLQEYPLDIDAKWSLGLSQYELGHYEEAKKTWTELNEHAPNWENTISQMLVRVETKIKASSEIKK